MLRRTIFAGLVCCSLAASATAASPAAQDGWSGFLPGRFVVVGRDPDHGPAYAGTAVIEQAADGLALARTIGTRTVTARAVVAAAEPPDEAAVLRFRWTDGDERSMTCLVHGDLDNYPRLTCLWVREGAAHRAPGLEAYFSTEAWPEAGATRP